jgi:hypothetical protein
MIDLKDAIERAKLAAGEDGLLSQYFYDQLTNSLSDDDLHTFVVSLVDFGIKTKVSSKEDIDRVCACLEAEERGRDILEEFVKAAQQYVQSPGGVWMPEDRTKQDEVKPYSKEEMPVDLPEDEYIDEQSDDSSYDVEYYRDILENAGLAIDKDGMVSQYKSAIPGVYNRQVPVKPMPLSKAIELFYRASDISNTERERISELQDVLSVLNSDFSSLNQDISDLSAKFTKSLDSLDKAKYSIKSPNKDIQSIAKDLQSVREYLANYGESVQSLTFGLDQYSDIIKTLQKRLDPYSQGQIDKFDKDITTAIALENLQDIQSNDPDRFKRIVDGLGGVSAKFSAFNLLKEYGEPTQEGPGVGEAVLEIGETYISAIFEDLSPGFGDKLRDAFVEDYAANGILDRASFQGFYDFLAEAFQLSPAPDDPHSDVSDNVTILISPGDTLSAIIGEWVYSPDKDFDSELSEGWYIEPKSVDDKELDNLGIVKRVELELERLFDED